MSSFLKPSTVFGTVVSLERSDSSAEILVVPVCRVLHFSFRDRAVVVPIPFLKFPSNFTSGDYIIPVSIKTPEEFSNNSLTVEVVSRHNFHSVAFALLASVVCTAFEVICMRQQPASLA